MELTDLKDVLNGFAGFAALINSLLLWPVVRRLSKLEPRVEALEEDKKDRERQKATLFAKMRRPRGAI